MDFFKSKVIATPPASALSLRHSNLSHLHASITMLVSKLSKKRTTSAGDKVDKSLLEEIASALNSLGEIENGEAYRKLGLTYSKLSDLQQTHLDQLSTTYLTALESKLFELNEAEKFRILVDKLNKVKKGNEEELNTAKVAHEDAEFTLERKLAGIENSQQQEINHLENYLDSEIAYTKKYLSLLISAKSSFPPTSNSLVPPAAAFQTRMSRSYSDPPDFSATPRAKKGERRSTVTSNSITIPVVGAIKEAGRSRSGSLKSLFSREKEGKKDDDFSFNGIKKTLGASIGPTKYATLPDDDTAPPRSKLATPIPISPPFVRAATAPLPINASPIGRTYSVKWEFTPSSSGELELKFGSKILVEKVINGDWWSGLIVTAEADEDVSKKGMFPSTFIESIEEEISENPRWSITSSSFSNTYSNTDGSSTDDHAVESEGEELRPNSSTNDEAGIVSRRAFFGNGIKPSNYGSTPPPVPISRKSPFS